MYGRFFKRLFDIVLSLMGMVLGAWLFLVIIIAMQIDDPGCAIFTQKRVGRGKSYFMLYKFRSMKTSTPHDVPTHLLEAPEQYITRVGRFLRKTSLDELPQLLNILKGEMSLVGPRPALWNQYDLVAERDRYGANDIRPGLTGWAQINGRDELEIPVKAKLDGVYAAKLKKGGFKAFFFDCRCVIGTVFSVARADGVVEGGTGEMHRHENGSGEGENNG